MFQEDTPEILLQCYKSDNAAVTVFAQLEIDDRDRRLVEHLIKENYTIIKEMYQHVQGRSLSYPLVDSADVYKHLFKHLGIKNSDNEPYSFAQFSTIMPQGQLKNIKRFHIIELIVRLAFQ